MILISRSNYFLLMFVKSMRLFQYLS